MKKKIIVSLVLGVGALCAGTAIVSYLIEKKRRSEWERAEEEDTYEFDEDIDIDFDTEFVEGFDKQLKEDLEELEEQSDGAETVNVDELAKK